MRVNLFSVLGCLLFFSLVLSRNVISLPHSEESIRIAYVGGLTGNVGEAAQKSLKALQLLIDSVNKKGGIRGRKIELLAHDNKFSPAENISIFKKIQEEKVVAIVGVHASNDGLILAKLAEEARIPIVVASATHPDITKGRKFVVRACFTDDAQGDFIANFMKYSLKAKRFAVVVDVSDSFTDYLAKIVTEKFRSQGGTVADIYPIRTGDQDFSAIISSMRAKPLPEVIFTAASALESSYFVSSLTKAQIAIPIMGNDGWQNHDLGRLLKNLEQTEINGYFTAHWYREFSHPTSRQFIKDFESKYGQALSSFDADPVLTYDAGKLLIQALEKTSSTDPEALVKALKTAQIEGVTGKIRYGKTGDPEKKIHLLRIVKGTLVTKEE